MGHDSGLELLCVSAMGRDIFLLKEPLSDAVFSFN